MSDQWASIVMSNARGYQQITCRSMLWGQWRFFQSSVNWKGFPDSSICKEYTCNVGDSSSIPGLGRSTGQRIGYPHQYSWASLVTQLVKNLPAVWEIWAWSLGWEDPLEKGKATHSSNLAWRIPWIIQFMGSQRVRHDWATFTFTNWNTARGIAY